MREAPISVPVSPRNGPSVGTRTIRRRALVTLSLLLVLAGCDLFGEDDDADPEVLNAQAASFGLRVIYGINPDAAGGPKVFGGLFYDAADTRIFADDPRVELTFNGEPVRGALFFDDEPFPYVPGQRYELAVRLADERVEGAITAPMISDVLVEALPDSLCDNQPVRLSWRYPDGERNDGLLLVQARGYISEHLDPSTTSHTIPANALRGFWDDQTIQVISVRSVLFPNLHAPTDDGIRFAFGYGGSFFSVFVASEVVRTYIRRSDFDAACDAFAAP